MGSPPIPDRSPIKGASRDAASSSRPVGFGDAPPRPHPGIRPAVAPASVPFSPPKRRTGGSIKGKERAASFDPFRIGDGHEGNDDDDDDDQNDTGDLGGMRESAGTAAIASNRNDPAFPPQTRPTYRHILGSGNGGAANPLRTIAHIDIDAAYAAMEMARLKIPQDQPMAVQQWNGLIAVNYPARAYGITRHETPAEALKKCPDLMLVHVQTYKNGETEPGYWDGAKPETHKVSLDMYRKESKKILNVFGDFCPIVEKASIDESFLDLTLPVRERLLEAYPALATAPDGDLDAPLPPPSELGITADSIKWDELGNLVPVEGQKREKVRRLDPTGAPMPSSSSPAKASQVPSDGVETDAGANEEGSAMPPPAQRTSPSESPGPTDPPLTWSDISLSLGAAIVRDTRAAVTERLGYTCSAGIAPNKMLAKLTSAWKKPNAQTILRYSAIPAFLRPMPFQKIRNLGGKLGTAVKETYEANTVGDLLDYSLPELKAKLGDASGMWLWEIVRGLDYTEVDPKTAVKSMLSSKNFRPYINKYGDVMHWLNILATELHLRLTDARDETPGLWPKTITFTHRSPTFVIRSHQAPFPFTSNLTIAYILKAGEKLFRTAIGAGQSTERITNETTIGPYSNLQLSFSGLEKLEGGQRGIEGFFSAAAAPAGSTSATARTGKAASVPPKEENGRDGRAASNPPAKKGVASFFPATSATAQDKVKSSSKKRKSESSRNSPALVSLGNNADGTEEMILASSSDEEADIKPPPPKRKKLPLQTHRCERCQKVLTVADDVRLAAEKEGKVDSDKALRALERAKAEHADYHVARELLEQERKAGGWSTTSSTNGKPSNKKRKVDGNASPSHKAGAKKEGEGRSKVNKSKGTLNAFVSRG